MYCVVANQVEDVSDVYVIEVGIEETKERAALRAARRKGKSKQESRGYGRRWLIYLPKSLCCFSGDVFHCVPEAVLVRIAR